MSDGPAKIPAPPEPLDELILGEDDETVETPPVAPGPPPAPAPVETRGSQRPPSIHAPDPLKDTKKHKKLTLRIPDDEISRPNLPATTPAGGVPIVGGSRPPSQPDHDLAAMQPIKAQPVVSIGSPDDTLELPPSRAKAKSIPPAAGIDATTEKGWTPYSPNVDGGNGAKTANGRETPIDPPPTSEEIPVALDDDEEEDLTVPRLPLALDSEEIKLDENQGDRATDPGELPEVSPDDLVSVESIPQPHQAPPPPKKQATDAKAPTAAQILASSAAPAPAAAAPATTAAAAPASAPVASPVAAPAPAPAKPVAAAPQPQASQPAPLPSQPKPVAPSSPQPAAAQAKSPLVFVPPVGALAPPPMTESAANRKKVRPWWEELFNDDYIRTMAKINDRQIGAECTFIEDSLGCEAGAMILDLACGTGRHAVELAKRGYSVVGFDLSLSMLARASDEAQEHGQKINFVQGDMREMTFEETFDGIYSWNTSFGFFDEEKNNAVIARVHRALKKGGQFLLDVVNRDYIVRQAPSLAWFEGDGCICMDEMQIDFITSRMRVKRTLMMDDGRTKEIEYSIRCYSLHELGKMLHDNGFRVAEVSGRTGTPGVFFGCESPRTLILAEKR